MVKQTDLQAPPQDMGEKPAQGPGWDLSPAMTTPHSGDSDAAHPNPAGVGNRPPLRSVAESQEVAGSGDPAARTLGVTPCLFRG